MEVAGVGLAVPGVVKELLNILNDLGDDVDNVIEPNKKRYKLILETLALIASVFANVEQLKKSYGISQIAKDADVEVEGEVQLSVGNLPPTSRSSATLPLLSTLRRLRSGIKSRKAKGDVPVPRQINVYALPDTSTKAASLASTRTLALRTPSGNVPNIPNEAELSSHFPDIEEFTNEMLIKANEYQKTISTLKRYKWAYTSGEKPTRLVNDLKKYVEHLYSLTKYPLERLKHAPMRGLPAPFYEFNVGKQLPHSPMPNFCGREDVLREMESHLTVPVTRKGSICKRAGIILHGMGGIGKTQIALEYISRSKSYSAVFWVDATDQSTINESGIRNLQTLVAHYATKHNGEHRITEAAADLRIPGQVKADGTLTDKVAKDPWFPVKQWLAREDNLEWCLVVDGVNIRKDVEAMQELLPPCSHGHIIVTSRIRIYNAGYELIDIPLMDRDSCLSLLIGAKAESVQKESKSFTYFIPPTTAYNILRLVRDAAETIAKNLGYLPLALYQVTAYVTKYAANLIEYLDRLTRNKPGYIGGKFSQYENGVISCWQLSVQALMESMPHSIDLLRLCSFLGPGGVSKELLYRGLSVMEYFNNDKSQLEDSLNELVQYAMMKRISTKDYSKESSEDIMYWIHPLVRDWFQETYLDGESFVLEKDLKQLHKLRTDGALKATILIGCSLKTSPDTREACDWGFERRNMTHIALCLDTYVKGLDFEVNEAVATREVALALANFGRLKFCWGEYFESSEMLKLSIRLYERLLPAQTTREVEKELLLAKQYLSSVYINRDRLDSDPEDVEKLLDELLSRQRQLLEPTDADLLWTEALKARNLAFRGRDDEALDQYTQCVEKTRKYLDPGHPVNLSTIHSLAVYYDEKGESINAEKMYRESLELDLKYRGPNHQDTLIAFNNIAIFRRLNGDFEGQLECLKRAAEGSEATFGLAQWDTISAMRRLEDWYRQADQHVEADVVRAKIEEGERVLGNAIG
ncbi:hypothetical protein N0V90_011878 [Kalmusia sp. IMI 367209]|nr:hypothetical protein N0V90_011878 [Kalmusia sp. IMI 367209]